MAAPAELRSRPAAGDPKVSPADGGMTVDRRPGRSPVRPQPARRAAPTPPPVRLRRIPALSPRRLGRVEATCVPAIRRGRPMHLLAAAVVTFAVIGGLGWLGQASGAELPAETALVRVGAGETVWDVAQRVAPESDPRTVVERIRQLNGMADSAVRPGQQLQVPDGR